MQDITKTPRLAELTTRDVGERLAILAAMEKMIKDETRILKGEMRQRLMDSEDFDSIPLSIGGQKVGRYYTTQATPGVGDADEFGEWAYLKGMGTCDITVTIDNRAIAGFDSERERGAFAEELLDVIQCAMYAYDVESPKITYKANPDAIKTLKVINGAVVDYTGEVVPGAYAKAPQGRITPIKPHEVAEAMKAAKQNPSVVALLEG